MTSGKGGRIGWDRRVWSPSGTSVRTPEETDAFKQRVSEHLDINERDVKVSPEASRGERVSRLQSSAAGALRAQGHKLRDDVRQREARLCALRKVINTTKAISRLSNMAAAQYLKRNHPQFSSVSVNQLRQDIAAIKKADGHSKTKN